MAIFDLSENPSLVAKLMTGDTVTVSMADRTTGAAVPLAANAATEIGATGNYRYTLNMTNKPASGTNYYVVTFTGTLQTREVLMTLEENRQKYGGVVYLDTTGLGTPGVGYPTGTDFQPSSNLADAITIAARINTRTIRLRGALTLTQSVAGYEFVGVGAKELNLITLNSQDIDRTIFSLVNVTGVSNGAFCYMDNCWTSNITGLNCAGEYLKMAGNYVMAMGGSFACANVKSRGPDPVTFDMNLASAVGLVEVDGIFGFSNLASPLGFIAVTGNHNTVIDATVTAGNVYIGGVGTSTLLGTPTTYTNQSVPYTVFNENLNSYSSPGTAGQAIASVTFDNNIWIDAGSAFAGVTYPVGTSFAPVNNLAAAVAIATARSIKNFKVRGTLVVTVPLEGYVFEGSGSLLSDILVLTGTSIDGSLIQSLTVTGTQVGVVNYSNCMLQDIVNFSGIINSSALGGTIALGTFGAYLFGQNINSISNVIIDTGGPGRTISIGGASGVFTVRNCQGGAPFPTAFNVLGTAAQVIFEASCTGGTAGIMGDAVVINAGAIVVTDIGIDGRHGAGSWEAPIGWQFTAADDGTDARFALWMEREGVVQLDFDSIAAAVHTPDGALVHDLGIDSADTGDGIFAFAMLSADLLAGQEYYLACVATRGAATWHNNLGFSKV